ncbi:MAG: chorismate synthase [Flavobacteriales bacterium]|nr:chorismate synthase [Flavobacteriales bacterium]
MNSFGRIFRMHIFGESHGKGVGLTLDGVPSGMALTKDDFIGDISRRKPGAKGTTPRLEKDMPEILSGVFEGKTTGAPLSIWFSNENVRSKDYSFVKTTPRPGHSDWVADKKFKGFNDYRGGGHFSGRLSLCLVAAGVVAKKIINDISISAGLIEAGGERNFEEAIDQAIAEGDSIGGIIECKAQGMPVGLGEPFFDSLESAIAHLVFAVPATKGIEFGSGFSAAKMKGSEHNDAILDESGKTESNHAGGINGGISNGNDLVFRVAIKPTSSIAKAQNTLNTESGETDKLEIKGRHDACIALRAPVVIEAITAIALADLSVVNKAIHG